MQKKQTGLAGRDAIFDAKSRTAASLAAEFPTGLDMVGGRMCAPSHELAETLCETKL